MSSLYYEQLNKNNINEKSTEELKYFVDELQQQYNILTNERKKMNEERKILESKINNIFTKNTLIRDEIKRREDIIESKEILKKQTQNIEGIELLTEDEIVIITSKMNRTDYRKNGNYPRFIDLDRICKEVIEIKKRYPQWKLSKMGQKGQYDTLPPHVFYMYEYKDQFNTLYSIGGINF